MRFFYYLSYCLLLCNTLIARTIFVSPDGSDSNTGTKTKPIANLQTATELLQPGDSLLIREGEYKMSPWLINKKGKPDAWITIMAFPGEKVTVNGSEFLKETPEGREGSSQIHFNGTIKIEKAAFIKFKGICVFDSYAAGILVRESKNIDISYCRTILSYNSGIGLWHSDSVKVFYCEVMLANSLSKLPKGRPCHYEPPHEAISVASTKHFEIAYNYLHSCQKEGIDVKETSAHGTVHHNYLHDIARQGLYADSWFGLLEDVSFYANTVFNSEIGISISGEGKNSSLKNVKVYNNLIYNCRAAGIIFSRYGNDEPRSEVDIINNTVYNCGMPGHWIGKTGGIDVRSANMKNVRVMNNIAWRNWGFDIASFDSTADGTMLKEKNIIITNNLSGKARTVKTNKGFFDNQVYVISPKGNFIGDPLFTDPFKFDFAIAKNSPAASKSVKGIIPGFYLPYLGADSKKLQQEMEAMLRKIMSFD